MDDMVVTASSLLREVNPVVRFFRALVLYLVVSFTAIALILVPENWLIYGGVILLGSNILLIFNFTEEAISQWKEKATTN